MREKIRMSVKKLLSKMLGDGRRETFLFRLAKGLAQLLKVDAAVIARAEDILLRERSPLNALRYLSCFMRMRIGLAIPAFSFNLAILAGNDEHLKAALNMTREALVRTRGSVARRALKMQACRLMELPADDERVKEVVEDMLDDAVSSMRQANHRVFAAKRLRTRGEKELRALKAAFDRYGKRFFLLSGTLLAAIRDKGFRGDDDDIDVGVFRDEASPDEVRRILADAPLYLQADDDYRLGYISATGIAIDIFFIDRAADGCKLHNTNGVVEWRYEPFDLVEAEVLGGRYFIPKEAERVLAENYGDWKSKPLFFHYLFDTPNVSFRKTRETRLFLAEQLAMAIRRRDRYAAMKLITLQKKLFGVDYGHLLPSRKEDEWN